MFLPTAQNILCGKYVPHTVYIRMHKEFSYIRGGTISIAPLRCFVYNAKSQTLILQNLSMNLTDNIPLECSNLSQMI